MNTILEALKSLKKLNEAADDDDWSSEDLEDEVFSSEDINYETALAEIDRLYHIDDEEDEDGEDEEWEDDDEDDDRYDDDGYDEDGYDRCGFDYKGRSRATNDKLKVVNDLFAAREKQGPISLTILEHTLRVLYSLDLECFGKTYNMPKAIHSAFSKYFYNNSLTSNRTSEMDRYVDDIHRWLDDRIAVCDRLLSKYQQVYDECTQANEDARNAAIQYYSVDHRDELALQGPYWVAVLHGPQDCFKEFCRVQLAKITFAFNSFNKVEPNRLPRWIQDKDQTPFLPPFEHSNYPLLDDLLISQCMPSMFRLQIDPFSDKVKKLDEAFSYHFSNDIP